MKERKVSIFLFSLVFAVLVWISVNLGNTFQADVNIPIRIENLPLNKAVSSSLPSSLKLKIQGTGWQILNTRLSPTLYYLLDFNSVSLHDTSFTNKQFLEHSNLSKDIKIIESFPETLVVRIDEVASKRVPIIPVVRSQFRNGFGLVGKIKTSPDSITLFGAITLLQKITSWKTKELALEDIFTPIHIGVEISDSLSIQITRSITTATVSFDVQSIAEKKIENIPVEILQVPENRTVVLIPQTISIIIRSGVYTIAQISEKDFNAYVDYKTILLDTSGFVQPIVNGPDIVKIVQTQPEKLQYVIRK